jgi:thiamine monophosphate synthase
MSAAAAHGLARPLVSMVTDTARYGAPNDEAALRRLGEDVRRAAWSGVDLIQVRERMTDRDLLVTTRHVLAAVKGTAARVLVNARADVALAAPSDGVHLPRRRRHASGPCCLRGLSWADPCTTSMRRLRQSGRAAAIT